jgi:hypothetical protein
LVPDCMATSRPKPVEAPVTKATYAVVSTKKIWDFWTKAGFSWLTNIKQK